ncbi:FGGY-family carbohydrate kinase [soil metagenome]
MADRHAIVVLDVGKSNAKLALVDTETRAQVSVRTTPNVVVRGGPYPHFDVERLFAWVVDGLRDFAREATIGAISTTTHGASAALLAGDDLALPVLDYEHDGPESIRVDYDRERGAFAETLSPNLPNGLNLGRQITWQARAFPEAFARVDAILPLPQYWAWRLGGSRATEVTSLGCHTDLWNPTAGTWSGLAARKGWTRLFPPLANAWDTLGVLRPEIAAACGIGNPCRVVAGIHDSNASLLPHLIARRPPFSVVSTGTWMITLAVGGSVDRLDAARDCLANVDALGRPVPSSRAMAGREFELLTAGVEGDSSSEDVARVVADQIMVLPSFAPGTGPFPKREAAWTVDPRTLPPGVRITAASLYCALLAETCHRLAGADGPILVEGPFARNQVFLGALATLVSAPVIAEPDATGTTSGAALLAFGPDVRIVTADPPPIEPLAIDLAGYAAQWRGRAEGQAFAGKE